MTMTPGRLPLTPIIFVALLISGGSLARDGAPHGDRSADTGGSGFGSPFGNDRKSGSGDAAKHAARKGHVRDGHSGRSRLNEHDRAGALVESPYAWPEFYYWPYYSFQPYPAPSAVAPFSPPAYIDQGTVLNAPSFGPNSQDYCSSPAGYYPYVQECPSGWQRITLQPIEQQPGYGYYCTHPSGSYPYNRECATIWRSVVP